MKWLLIQRFTNKLMEEMYVNSVEWCAMELVYFMNLRQYIKPDTESLGLTDGMFAFEGDSSLSFRQRQHKFLYNKAIFIVRSIWHITRMIASQSQLVLSTRSAQMQKLQGNHLDDVSINQKSLEDFLARPPTCDLLI
jgi:hypothetical protein